jgi:lipopolysaccharide transport system ATP-binding protein
VLFVSHNMQAVASLCSRGILLDAGQVANNGDVNTVVNQYLTMVVRSTSRQREQIWDASDLAAPGNDKIRLRRTAIVPETGPVDSLIDMNTAFRIEVEYWNLVEGSSLILTLSLFALDGSPVFECSTTKEPHWNGKSFPRGLFRSVCFIPADLMNEGSYRIRLHFVTDQLVGVYTCSEAATVSISDSRPRHTSYYGRFIGNVHPHLAWQTALLEKTNNLEFAAKQTK